MENKPIIQERQAIESAPISKPARKIFWSGDKLIGISALLVSIASVSVIFYQTHLMQKQQYASALPYLELWNNGGSDAEYRLSLINNGIGPAFIKEVRVIYKGKMYEGDQTEFLYKVIFPQDTSFLQDYSYSNLYNGRMIPAGKEFSLLHIQNSEIQASKYRKLFGNQDSAKLEIIYSSVYDEKWKLTGVGGISEKIKE